MPILRSVLCKPNRFDRASVLRYRFDVLAMS